MLPHPQEGVALLGLDMTDLLGAGQMIPKGAQEWRGALLRNGYQEAT